MAHFSHPAAFQPLAQISTPAVRSDQALPKKAPLAESFVAALPKN